MKLSRQNSVENNLKDSLICCQKYIKTLNGVAIGKNNVLQWFRVLCEHMTKIIILIRKYYKNDREKFGSSVQNTILLYLTQMLTSLSLVINVFVKEDEATQVLVEARKCVVKQIVCCLESIDTTLNFGNSLNDPAGNFVKWMDAALDKISEIDIDQAKTKAAGVYEETRELFEEVLSHAMSIAQVSLTEDSKIIRGSCQAVLCALNSLDKEVNNAVMNGAMVNLFVDTCSNKICMLERKVNTAVLKLCLKTFSQLSLPLEKIQMFCFDPSNNGNIEKLDALVVDFDLHVDRIMQIGLFAVSCSTDIARGINIRSCLASLEALENELVPVLTSVLLDKTVHNTNCALLLMKHWLGQATLLQQHVFHIIDPFAFCQIIYDEANETVDTLSQLVKKKIAFQQHYIDYFVNIVHILKTFLEEAHVEFSENEKNKLKSKLNDFNSVLEEVESASKVLLGDKPDLERCIRMLKRCKILTTIVKRLWYCFADDVPKKNISLVSEKQALELPSKLENLQIETGNAFLDHIINRGKQILQDRSVLYRTPVKTSTSSTLTTGIKLIKSKRKEIPLSKLVHLRNRSFINSKVKNETSLDLQITDILGEMTSLSTTFDKPR